jgi:hypothetical protein
MTNLPALREALATMTDWRLEVFTEWLFDRPHADDCPCSNDSERHAPGCGNCECENHDIADLLANYKALRNAAPALLDEVEQLRMCNDILRQNNLTLKDDSHALDTLRAELASLQQQSPDTRPVVVGARRPLRAHGHGDLHEGVRRQGLDGADHPVRCECEGCGGPKGSKG